MTNFNISIVSDTVCPWVNPFPHLPTPPRIPLANPQTPQCYVGKNKLEAGISTYKRLHPNTPDTFSTTWLPFYLNPHAPKTGIDKRAYYAQKFGPERTAAIFERLAAVGKAVGIDFKFGGKTGNTRDSHRLIQLGKSKSPQVQTRVVEELFRAYFEQERDITSHDVLQDAGVKAGLDDAEVKAWLGSGRGGEEVDREVAEAQMRGVGGVPNFTLQGKYEIGGAQDAEAFVRVFERVKAMEGA
jgi:predicted DsbA family dithiol-disulfide isomerase